MLISFNSVWLNSMSFNSVWFNSVSFNSVCFNSVSLNSVWLKSMSFNSVWFAHFVPADVSTLLVACTQFLPSLYSIVILTGKSEPLPCSFDNFTSQMYWKYFKAWFYFIYLTSFLNYCKINIRDNTVC